jgi:protein ImuA
MQTAEKNDILLQLQKEILSLQGFRAAPDDQRLHSGLGIIEKAFPNNTFPTAAIHEFISNTPEDAAATSGFMTGLLSTLIQNNGTCLWISTRRNLFPPALKTFGIEPERIIFIDVNNPKDALWTIEEALKCGVLAAVVGEISELNFTQSRRLQLAVEQSKVTGFIHRHQPKTEGTVACVSRWKIAPMVSASDGNIPGIGFPRWKVQLLKIRNGKPGTWQAEWTAGRFRNVTANTLQATAISVKPIQKTG